MLVALALSAIACIGDANHSRATDIDDLMAVVAVWGTCGSCTADLNHDSTVDCDDLAIVIADWGCADMALIDATLFQHTGVINGSSPSTGDPTFEAVPLMFGEVYSAKIDAPADASAMSFRLNAINATTYAAADMNQDDVYFFIPFMFTTFPASTSEEFISSNSSTGGTYRAAFRISSTQKIQFHDSAAVASNTPTATMSTTLTASQKYVAIIYSPTGTAASGSISLYSVASDYSLTHIETMACTGNWTSGQNLRLHCGRRTSRNNLAYLCNFGGCISSTTPIPTNIRTAYAKATQGGTYQDTDVVDEGAAAATVAKVNEIPIDADTTYLTWAADDGTGCWSALLQTYTAMNINVGATIIGVHPCPNTYGGGASFTTRFRIGGTDYDSATYAPGVSTIHMRGPWYLTHPDTSAWETTDLVNWEIGVLTPVVGTGGHVSNIGALVVYTPADSAIGSSGTGGRMNKLSNKYGHRKWRNLV